MPARLRLRAYVLTWLGLLALTALTFGLSFAHLGSVDAFVALFIAGLKASLVAVVFMHLYEDRGASRLVLVVTALLVALLVGLMAADVATREEDGAVPEERAGLR